MTWSAGDSPGPPNGKQDYPSKNDRLIVHLNIDMAIFNFPRWGFQYLCKCPFPLHLNILVDHFVLPKITKHYNWRVLMDDTRPARMRGVNMLFLSPRDVTSPSVQESSESQHHSKMRDIFTSFFEDAEPTTVAISRIKSFHASLHKFKWNDRFFLCYLFPQPGKARFLLLWDLKHL